MSKLIAISVDVTKLDKSKFITGKKGTYVNLTVSVNDSADQFGNDSSVWQSQSEEERKAKSNVKMDKERNSLRMALGGLLSALKKDNEDEASKALIAACVNAESMLTKEYINFFKLHD